MDRVKQREFPHLCGRATFVLDQLPTEEVSTMTLIEDNRFSPKQKIYDWCLSHHKVESSR
jgi:hypothetical protein